MSKILLKKRVAILVFGIGLLSALVMGGVVFLYLNKVLVANKQEQIIKETNILAEQSALVFQNNDLFVKMLATRTRVKEFLLDQSEARRSELENIFLDYAREDKKYLAIYLLDKKGQCLISTDERFVGQDYSFRDYFKSASNGQPTVAAALGKTSQQFGYYFSQPIKNDDGLILGVMMAKVDPADIDKHILASELSQNSVVMLSDQNGVILISGQAGRVFKSFGSLTVAEQTAIKQDESFGDQEIFPLHYDKIQEALRSYSRPIVIELEDKVDKDKEIFNLVKVPGQPFFLVTETRLDDITNQVWLTVAIILAIILAGLLIKSFSLYYIMATLLKPLKKLQDFSKNIGRGDFSQRVDIRTGDEFGDLAESFNKMNENLADLYNNLDKKVALKIKDIDKKNQQLSQQKEAVLNILEDAKSEKERAEALAEDLEKFKLAVVNASDHIIITDKEGIILFANHAVENITGFKPDQILGKKAGSKDLWGGEMEPEFYKKLWQTIKTEKKNFSGEINNHRQNGEKYIAKASISPILDKKGEVAFFVAIERDITKEKMVDKAKSEFVSLASHQLRTPLSAIKWTLEAFSQDDGLAPKHKERIKDVYDSNERLIALVNDLLNVSHIEDGKVIIKKEVVDIKRLTEETLKNLRINADKKQQTLQLTLADELKPVKLDVLRFGEALSNLVSNAINYAPSGQTISIKVVIEDKNYVVSIHNDEPIIPATDQAKLFTKFYRGTNSQIVKTTGSGLGLFIAKAAVEENGGKIWFTSKAGEGTTFFFTVPRE